MPQNNTRTFLLVSIALITVFALGAVTGSFLKKPRPQLSESTQTTKPDPYIEFLSEVYDKIKENYWDKINDGNLVTLFKLGAEKLTGNPLSLKSLNKEELRKSLTSIIINSKDEKQKKDFSVNLAGMVLANLSPFGRSGLYTTKEETALKNNVANINPDKNLYQDLGVSSGSSSAELQKSYEKNKSLLERQKQSSPEAAKKLEQVYYAYGILSDRQKKEDYDKYGVEPTVIVKLIKENILYLQIKKISPTTFDEIQRETSSIKESKDLNSLIVDLRGNIGGSIDLLPYLLGPFIGQNQYAYEFFHQGETTPNKTKTGFIPSLLQYKKVITLIDNQTQSSAEVIAATLKKYNVGITLGTTTRGWGTVEKVFTIDHQIDPSEKYSLFLVHSLTLRDDGQSIEGKGVDPLINISDPSWESRLNEYYNFPELGQAVKILYNLK